MPTWFSAVGTLITAGATLAALIAAAMAVRASWAVLKLEQARENRAEAMDVERRKAAERAEQADVVAAWMHYFEGEELSPGRVRLWMKNGWGALVRNTSSLPVYDVVVEFYGPMGGKRGENGVRVCPPGETSIRPDGDLRQELPDGGGMERIGDFRIALSFRDAAGRQWRRDENGVLTQKGFIHFATASDTLTTSDSVTVKVVKGDSA